MRPVFRSDGGTLAGGTKGLIFDIQKFSIHDGPGIRTTVFLKGCPLRCLWCHNPESQARKPEISFLPEKCIQCGYCARVCPSRGHLLENGGHTYDRTNCTACGACTRECWSKALERIGREITVEDALAEVMKDRAFYQHSGGGLTLSGGEPLLQFEFTRALLSAAKREGLHSVVETCGQTPGERYAELIPLVDLFYFDFKEADSALHREYTGVGNEAILENLRRLDAAGAAFVLRCPIISGLNDRTEHFEAIATLARESKNMKEIHILPYHNLGSAKAGRLGGTYPLAGVGLPEDAVVDAWVAAVQAKCAVKVRRD